MKKKEKKGSAFTIVINMYEIIVVVLSLSILVLLAFICYDFSVVRTRDAERLADTRMLFGELIMENAKWTPFSRLQKLEKENYITVLWKETKSSQWIVSISSPHVTVDDIRDPKTWKYYPFAYLWVEYSWWIFTFIELATINEQRKEAIIVWNYYVQMPWDAEGLITNDLWMCIKNYWSILPYSTE